MSDSEPTQFEIIESQSLRILELEKAVKDAEVTAFARGVAYHLAKAGRTTWIPTEQRLPPPGVDVWVCSPSGVISIDSVRMYRTVNTQGGWFQFPAFTGKAPHDVIAYWAEIERPVAPAGCLPLPDVAYGATGTAPTPAR